MKKLNARRLLCGIALMTFMGANAQNVEVATGDYQPDWESLKQWECPEWFMDAKFGIWAHWGPQCHAESGDWYARHMYYENEWQSIYHQNNFGWMSEYGLKELCRDWKAEQWNPDELISFYKSVGARYFMALGNHHDNFDLWNSPYQEWNSVSIGPKKDLLKGWADACEKYGLPLGVSMHASHAWTWLEMSQWYDGNLTKEDGYELNADGTEKWWKGMDPQELYAQQHEPSVGYENVGTIHSQWAWGNGASLPSEEYKQKFQNRVLECINSYKPDMIYFDDTVLPFYGCDESIGLNILSHYYNKSASENGGEQQVVVTGKILEKQHKELMLWDVERGIPDRPQEKYWQTCTCLGSWHYDKGTYDNNGYKSAQQVISMLVDIVSKNGNMLLSVPVRSNGTIDDKEIAILNDIKDWMDVNSISIYGTRPWKTFGEGPLAEASNPLNSQGFNEGNNYSSADVRFVERNDTVFATTLRYPSSKKITIESLGIASKYYSGKVKSVTLLGHGSVDFTLDIDGLVINMPEDPANALAAVFAIEFEEGAQEAITLAEIIEIYEAKVDELLLLSGYNTGKFSREKVYAFAELVNSYKQSIGTDDVTQQLAIKALHEAYAELKDNGINEGGAPNLNNSWDYTADCLVEANSFSRIDPTVTTRFGTPLNWTVENFYIPNGGDGIKNGLDNYTGKESLMLGVWNDRDANQVGDLSDARIYRKVYLEPGRYYFGATYNALYQLSDNAYIFAADDVLSTDELADNSIAFARLNKGATDGNFYGIYFTLEEAQDVVLGFQIDLLDGSATQEMRADDVMLLYYGEMDYFTLEDLRFQIEEVIYTAEVNDNTGFYSKSSVAKLETALASASKVDESASFDEILAAYNALNEAYEDFKANGVNPGGAPMQGEVADLTVDVLSEASNFSRSENGTLGVRYGTPLYWTVENYNIPAGGQGNRNGIDSWPGYDCLSLGVWNDAGSNSDGDLSNARIYQRVTLQPGRYYFGATYNTTYSIGGNAYIFASPETISTADIPIYSIAYYPINNASDEDGKWHGIFFTLEEEQEVVLGFQADLTAGSSTKEFRAKGVKLLYYGEITYTKLEELISLLDEKMKTVKINDNTGFYSVEAYEEFAAAVEVAKAVSSDASPADISAAYTALNDAYNHFLTEGKNKSGMPEEIGATDITEQHLIESEDFSRLDPSITTRFSYPLYWTTENFGIESFTEGTRGGLDKWPGYDCLGIGVWDDKANNVLESDLTNTRLYRKASLEAGRYFFGAAYDANYNLNQAYVYVADNTLNTADIEQQSIAYHKIAEAPISNNIYGLYFTLDQPQEIVIAFQVDIENGPAAQEFRAKRLALLSYTQQTGIESVEKDSDARPDFNAPAQYYTITGAQLNAAPRQGMFIMRQNGNTFKIFRK